MPESTLVGKKKKLFSIINISMARRHFLHEVIEILGGGGNLPNVFCCTEKLKERKKERQSTSFG